MWDCIIGEKLGEANHYVATVVSMQVEVNAFKYFVNMVNIQL